MTCLRERVKAPPVADKGAPRVVEGAGTHAATHHLGAMKTSAGCSAPAPNVELSSLLPRRPRPAKRDFVARESGTGYEGRMSKFEGHLPAAGRLGRGCGAGSAPEGLQPRREGTPELGVGRSAFSLRSPGCLGEAGLGIRRLLEPGCPRGAVSAARRDARGRYGGAAIACPWIDPFERAERTVT
jgi:hypothetical protein